MKLIRSILSVGSYTLLSRAAGFVREMLQAMFVGAGETADALKLAIQIPSFFRRVFAEGAFNASFVPLFSGTLRVDGPKAAQDFARDVFAWLSWVLVGLTIVIELAIQWIIPIIAPGFVDTPHRLMLAIEFSRVTFPFLLFISLTAFYSSILNSFDRFVAAAASPFVGNLAIIVMVLALKDVFGIGPTLAWAVLACGVMQLVWVMWPMRRVPVSIRLTRPKVTPAVRQFFRRMVPGAIGSGVFQLNLLVDVAIASLLPIGTAAILGYADRLNQLTLSVVGTAVSTALLPLLSRQLKAQEVRAAMSSQNRSLEFSFLLTVPAVIGLGMLAMPITSLVFERGKISYEDALAIARTLQALLIGLPAYILMKIFSTTFFARGDTRTPVIVGVVGVLVNLGLNLLIAKRYYAPGLAFSTAMAAWVNTLILLVLLRRQRLFILDQRFYAYLGRLTMAALALGLVIFFMKAEVTPIFLAQGIHRHWVTAGEVMILGVGYLCLTWRMGLWQFDTSDVTHP